MNKQDKAREMVKANPGVSKASLARMLYCKYPGEWRDIEAARRDVRYVTGNSGAKHRKEASDECFSPEAMALRYGIPTSYAEEYVPYVVRGERMLVISDMHIPFHDRNALSVAIHAGVDAGCDTLLINGDGMDCHQVSTFRKDCPPKMRFRDELSEMRRFLDSAKRNFNKVVYKFGNHEERLETFLRYKCEELYDLPEYHLEYLLELGKRGIEVVKDKRIIRFDRLNILHGHEYQSGMSSPVNPARGLFLRAKAVALQGHCHQTSDHNEPTMEDRIIATWSCGCLCNLHPRWNPLNKWNHGFSIIHRNKKGKFLVDNKRIIHGEVC